MSGDRRSVGVSIVGFHSDPVALGGALRSLADQTLPPERVRVHLNEASAAEAAAVEAGLQERGLDLSVSLTWSADNRGFAAGHNRLLAEHWAAGMELVLVHNPDLLLHRTAVAVLADAAGRRPLALHGPLLEQADAVTLRPSGRIDTAGIRWSWDGRHFDQLQGSPLSCAPASETRVPGISGACLAVPRSAHDRIVGVSGEFFDEAFVAYREDAELAYRAGLLGVDSYLQPAARGRHVRRQRGTVRGQDPLIDRLGVRNRFLIAEKYGRRRPGGVFGPTLRDLVVLAAVFTAERDSLAGVIQAWRLRSAMRAKGATVLAVSRACSTHR